MADMALQVVVSPLLGVVFDKLSSPLLKEFGLLWGVEKDLEKLSRTSSTVSRVLEDAELKQIDDATTRDWLRKLKEVVYESDDIIDECMTEALYSPHSEVSNGSCSTQLAEASVLICRQGDVKLICAHSYSLAGLVRITLKEVIRLREKGRW